MKKILYNIKFRKKIIFAFTIILITVTSFIVSFSINNEKNNSGKIASNNNSTDNNIIVDAGDSTIPESSGINNDNTGETALGNDTVPTEEPTDTSDIKDNSDTNDFDINDPDFENTQDNEESEGDSTSVPAVSPTHTTNSIPESTFIPPPTVTSTKRPAVTPTKQPTVTPTKRPAVTPTKQPAVTPTKRPAVTPTKRPAVTPTKRPAVTPTKRPAVTPTKRPAVTPTKRPTITPTKQPTTPTSKPTPTPRPTIAPTEPPKDGDYSVSYNVLSDWGHGATVMVVIKNSTSANVNSWVLTWDFPDNQKISNLWNAQHSQTGNSVTVRGSSALGTGVIPAGGEVSFGFNVDYQGKNKSPNYFELNGVRCKIN